MTTVDLESKTSTTADVSTPENVPFQTTFNITTVYGFVSPLEIQAQTRLIIPGLPDTIFDTRVTRGENQPFSDLLRLLMIQNLQVLESWFDTVFPDNRSDVNLDGQEDLADIDGVLQGMSKPNPRITLIPLSFIPTTGAT